MIQEQHEGEKMTTELSFLGKVSPLTSIRPLCCIKYSDCTILWVSYKVTANNNEKPKPTRRKNVMVKG